MPNTTVLVCRDSTGRVPLKDWLIQLEDLEPRAHVKCLQRILQLEQYGFDLRRPAADILRDGIWELRAKLGKVHYRMLYFFSGKNVACLSHGFTKEGKVPDAEIDPAIDRKKLVARDRDRFTAEWEL